MNKKVVTILIICFAASTLMVFAQSKFNNELTSEDKCIGCHLEIDLMPENYLTDDVHLQVSLSCAGCHGGDSSSEDEEIAMSTAKGFIGIPAKKSIPNLCGKCHSSIEFMRQFQPRISTDQVSQYYTSTHGIKLKNGDKNVAECANCHTAHAILPAKDPRSTVYALNIPNTCNDCHGDSEVMSSYDIPINQFEEYSNSVHGSALLIAKDIGAPSCNDCHGNHGAAPPGLASISHVCGTCHINNMNYFNQSGMAQVFDEMDFHACEQCHGYHAVKNTSDDMIGLGENSTCIDCHEYGDEGYKSAEQISFHLQNLVRLYDSANVKLEEVKSKGMDDVEIGFKLKDAKQNLIQSRTLVHTFDENKVSEKSKEGEKLAIQAINKADEEISEYYLRRNGFAAATFIFIIFAIGLFFKIRYLDKKGLN